MLSRLFAGKNRAESKRTLIEGLEDRCLLTAAPIITGVVADNRGEVTISLSRTVTGVSKASVKLFTVGADGVIGDTDDVRQPSQVIYTPASGKITIKGKLAAGAGYRVRLQSALITSLDGRHLDGDFTGTLPSGDGHPGGNFSFQVKNDKSKTPTVRMSTTEGVMNIQMDETNTPLTVDNFLNYANAGDYDSSIFTRAVTGFIIQGGSMNVTSSNTMGAVPINAPVVNEYSSGKTLEPLRGTIALAKLGTDPNSATNQFFFNLTDNSSTLDSQNGGFTSFGTITNASGLAVMDAIAAKPQADLSSQISSSLQTATSTDVSTVPVENQAEATTALNPAATSSSFGRIAVLDKIRRWIEPGSARILAMKISSGRLNLSRPHFRAPSPINTTFSDLYRAVVTD